MNLVLWIVQSVLALLFVSGGAYKAFGSRALAKQFPALSRGGWSAVGALEVVGAVLLIVPAATGWMPSLTKLAAAALALESLALAAVYGRASLRLTAANPFVWAVAMALLAAFAFLGRTSFAPLP